MSAMKWDSRQQHGSTKAASLCLRDLYLWAYQRGATLDFSRPGKPTDNAISKRSTVASGLNAFASPRVGSLVPSALAAVAFEYPNGYFPIRTVHGPN